MKRQLSEKDIIICPNGQVKRKRFRRNRNINNLNINYLSGQTASKTATVVPVRPNGKEWSQGSNQRQSSSPIGKVLNIKTSNTLKGI